MESVSFWGKGWLVVPVTGPTGEWGRRSRERSHTGSIRSRETRIDYVERHSDSSLKTQCHLKHSQPDPGPQDGPKDSEVFLRRLYYYAVLDPKTLNTCALLEPSGNVHWKKQLLVLVC
ncbi:hypothetical protein Y1Q_0001497 [Alligator mississippiensis]|uniref:Uncharacterized protein n=1 Tax=Alligator mississippiensis TaxID=8496 RepID=A0A151M9P0_ALLMI|nr:hypothetical protein Y1Q_0001497 [Alligator mississippiensis]